MAPRKPVLTLGVEEEYLLVDPSTRELVSSPPASFMPACKEALGERVTYELLKAQVEVGTGVCRDVAEVRADLGRLRRVLAGIASEHGMALVAASTHPDALWDRQHRTEIERYRILTQDFQALARRLLVCGMHVHCGIEDEDLRIDLMNQAAYFLPHLLALSTSSPFWEGHDTGMKAFRPTIFGDLPRSGMPETFESYREWQRFVEFLAESGTCDDPSKIWWDIRPSAKNPTLEQRVTDICTSFEHAMTLTALYQCLLHRLWRLRAGNLTWRSYRRVLLTENKWRAQRWGIEGLLIDLGEGCLKPMAALVEELIELVREDAVELGCVAETEGARAIVAEGTSADRQLEVYRLALEAGATPEEARREVVGWLIDATVAGLPA
jgi:carboxylate-amine ligase